MLRDKTHNSLITSQIIDSKASRQKAFKREHFNLISLFNSLKSILGYRLQLTLKLEGLFAEYFSKQGTLRLLEDRFMEEIDNFRVTSYREEKLDYQLSWRRIKPVKKEMVTEMISQESITLGVEIISA